MAEPGQPRLVLMCGLPGSGKTTLGKRLAEDYAAVRLAPDEWMTHLGVDLYDEDFRDRLEKVLWQLAKELLRLGQSVVLESGFWVRADRDEKRLGARALGAAVELHYLDVPIDELSRRLHARSEADAWATAAVTRENLELYASWFEAPDPAELELFDPPAARRN